MGAEASAAFYFCTEDDKSAVGVVPFLGIHGVFSQGAVTPQPCSTGGRWWCSSPWAAADQFELSGGFGPGEGRRQSSWNAPILGARVGALSHGIRWTC